jgi:lycopene cyclase-like protein
MTRRPHARRPAAGDTGGVRDNVVVVGAGPAGRAAAAACASASLSVTLVAPDPGRPWRNVYGAWADELTGADRAVAASRYPGPVVRTDRVGGRVLGRTYVRLDNVALQDGLRARAARHGARDVAAAARHVTHDRDGSWVELADGRRLAAGVVVDASGHRPALAAPGRGPAPAWQVAYGIVGRFDPPVVPAGGMVLMDWRTRGGASGQVPTFCYSLDLGAGRALVEETVLAGRPAPRMAGLRSALEARLQRDGITVVETAAVERVRFPMGGAPPPRGQRVVAFGAAAGMVHPATGYQVAAALRTAPYLAAGLAGALGRAPARPEDVAAAGWAAVWPAERLRQRALHAFGLEVLLRFDVAALQRFFEAFFDLPEPWWRAYVSGAASAAPVARAMLAVAARLPARQRLDLAGAALGPAGARLLAGLAASAVRPQRRLTSGSVRTPRP